jgi:hypothetical protein
MGEFILSFITLAAIVLVPMFIENYKEQRETIKKQHDELHDLYKRL